MCTISCQCGNWHPPGGKSDVGDIHMAERRLFHMGDGVNELVSGQHCRHVAAGGGMADQGDDKIWPKYGKFYANNGVEALVRSGGVNTDQ